MAFGARVAVGTDGPSGGRLHRVPDGNAVQGAITVKRRTGSARERLSGATGVGLGCEPQVRIANNGAPPSPGSPRTSTAISRSGCACGPTAAASRSWAARTRRAESPGPTSASGAVLAGTRPGRPSDGRVSRGCEDRHRERFCRPGHRGQHDAGLRAAVDRQRLGVRGLQFRRRRREPRRQLQGRDRHGPPRRRRALSDGRQLGSAGRRVHVLHGAQRAAHREHRHVRQAVERLGVDGGRTRGSGRGHCGRPGRRHRREQHRRRLVQPSLGAGPAGRLALAWKEDQPTGEIYVLVRLQERHDLDRARGLSAFGPSLALAPATGGATAAVPTGTGSTSRTLARDKSSSGTLGSVEGPAGAPR
jgi:hypothetical protein